MSSVLFLIGKTLGKYQVVEHLGHGGMAEVYKAQHERLDRMVALKVLHPFLAEDEGFITRFEREARIVATLRHPNIVQVFDFDHSQELDLYYMVMEYIEGSTLKARLTEGPLPPDEATRIVAAIADALDYAHRRGMIHRDIKPANIMFTADGQPVLTDFGIARIISLSGLTASGAMVGTPAYMAPEVGLGQPSTPASDIYSLGVVLYQLITGRLPFESDSPMGLVMQHINDPVPPPSRFAPKLPGPLEAIILKTLAKRPEGRYASASALALELRNAMRLESPAVTTTTVSMPTVGQEAAAPPTPPTPTTPVVKSAAQAGLAAEGEPLLRTWPPRSASEATPATPRLEEEKKPTTPAPRPARRRLGWLRTLVILSALALVALLGWQRWGDTLTSLLRGTMILTSVPPAEGFTPTPTPRTERPAGTLTPAPETALPATVALPTVPCTFRGAAERIYTTPSSKEVAPGTQLIAYLTLRNTGECAWPAETQLAFATGEPLNAPDSLPVEPLAPGSLMQVVLPLRAPAAVGVYTSTWEIRLPNGEAVGPPIVLQIAVSNLPTATPNTVKTTPQPTTTPLPPLTLAAPALLDWQDDPTQGTWSARLVVQPSGGTGQYRSYRGAIHAGTELQQGIVEIRGTRCQEVPLTLWVVSGEQVASWDGLIPYPAPERCTP